MGSAAMGSAAAGAAPIIMSVWIRLAILHTLGLIIEREPAMLRLPGMRVWRKSRPEGRREATASLLVLPSEHL